MIQNKNILIGITGGIAAYKIPLLVRLLKQAGAHVQVICTEPALQFVTAQTLSVLSENKVHCEFFDPETHLWNHHVNLGLWADAFMIAPAGSNTLAKMVQGQCDNLLLTTYLSARCPVWVAPAMDLDMYEQPGVKLNLAALASRGVHVIDAEEGPLASGLTGKGRMAEPETLFQALNDYFAPPITGWLGKKVLVTAGPTYEAIDPVRFIGNHSSGKMGISIAEALANLGADVELVLGPTHLEISKNRYAGNICVSRVQSAKQMLQVCQDLFGHCDGLIMSAAVADYTPENVAPEKIKKSDERISLNLVKNPDILFELSTHRREDQFSVGFALETQNGEDNALQKLQKKHLDAIVLNMVNENTGFQSETNKIVILDKKGQKIESDLKSKSDIAVYLLEHLNLILFNNENEHRH
jgi:phosphopantothenoylcysteine decarboxylase/phosphopantothenate--cysteine ligase